MAKIVDFIEKATMVGVKWQLDSAALSATAIISGELIYMRFKEKAMEDFEMYRSDRVKSLFHKRAAVTYFFRNSDSSLFIRVTIAIKANGDVRTVFVTDQEL